MSWQRRLVYSGAAVATGAAGWTIGYQPRMGAQSAASAKALLERPEVAKFAEKLKAQGYVPDSISKPSVFADLHRRYMFSYAALSGPDKVKRVEPLRLTHPDTGATFSLFEIGPQLQAKAGFEAAAATLFDETLASVAFKRLPHEIGVTGTFEIEPIRSLPPPDGLIVLQALPGTAQGRRSEARGTIYALTTGSALCSARVIMVEPWWGQYVSLLI